MLPVSDLGFGGGIRVGKPGFEVMMMKLRAALHPNPNTQEISTAAQNLPHSLALSLVSPCPHSSLPSRKALGAEGEGASL